jgi:starch synthase (maltosyl-transferring)
VKPTAETSVIGRIPIVATWPSVSDGRHPVKSFVGEVLEFGATAFREGHDQIAVELILRNPAGESQRIRMSTGQPGLDQWLVKFQLSMPGDWQYRVSAWADDYESWLRVARVKVAADVDRELVLQEGRMLLLALADRVKGVRPQRVLREAIAALEDQQRTASQRLEAAATGEVEALARENPERRLETLSNWIAIRCDRKLAGCAAWYEFFPRSEGAKKQSDGNWQSGSFQTATPRLTEIANMGFDVVYLPPIHPIGQTHRKGKNNSLDTEPGDPGSPWAIGNSSGGHDSIHPDLGSEADFAEFVKAARRAGLEIAMDFALQASPDHPWVKTHPQWFSQRVDGSIAYAENPPKKYQDIYPINFDRDPQGILAESVRILNKWIGLGVTHFRVDNPHTKPAQFWQQLIAQINQVHPEVVFLAEAFTRPAVMHTLGKIGFQQSYTYFTWRNTKRELEHYLTEVAQHTPDFFRPNFWVNTPDILSEYLQFGGRPAFKIRAALAATATPLWGMYSGYELFEAVARPGAEESIDNEKYEYRPRDWSAALASGDSLAPYIQQLNQIRRENPSLQQLRNLRLHWSDDDAVLVYSKHLPAEFSPDGKSNAVIVVANVDPHSVRETTIHLDLGVLGQPAESYFDVVDLISGETYRWAEHNFVRLDAFVEPVHILRVRA